VIPVERARKPEVVPDVQKRRGLGKPLQQQRGAVAAELQEEAGALARQERGRPVAHQALGQLAACPFGGERQLHRAVDERHVEHFHAGQPELLRQRLLEPRAIVGGQAELDGERDKAAAAGADTAVAVGERAVERGVQRRPAVVFARQARLVDKDVALIGQEAPAVTPFGVPVHAEAPNPHAALDCEHAPTVFYNILRSLVYENAAVF
jgi:hypothetical protein